jgi:predicted nucleotidyltransferase
VLLAGLRLDLWERFRSELRSWKVPPLYAAVFGSAARGDGGVDSDIDLLVVHQVFPGEKRPKSVRSDIRTQVADAAGAVTLSATDRDSDKRWESQLADLHDRVERWTGNPLQIVDLSFYEWRHPPQEYQPLLSDVSRDGVELVKARGLKIWTTTEPVDG